MSASAWPLFGLRLRCREVELRPVREKDLPLLASIQPDDFPVLRTVDSGSWLVESARGRGVGVAMRMAVLGLAFDRLQALAAVSSARHDNGASLGASRRIGYTDNGVSPNAWATASSS
jgi:RimJ/RimL family protein N-acetyltransferase